MEQKKRGLLNLYIDEIVPCLKNAKTNEIVETVVFKIETRSFLKKFNKKNGWHENWSAFSKEVEIYALATKNDMEIQGLIALENDVNAQAVFITWACTAPHNDKHELKKVGKTPKYIGVGGHLFAIAIDKSLNWGYGGCIHGYAVNQEVLLHYQENLDAVYLGTMHRYHFAVFEQSALKLLEVYDYEWNDTSREDS